MSVLKLFYICLLYESLCFLGSNGHYQKNDIGSNSAETHANFRTVFDVDKILKVKTTLLPYHRSRIGTNHTTVPIPTVVVLYCESEPFEHIYLIDGKRVLHKNSWKKTAAGDRGTLHDVCLLTNGLPLFRRCNLDSNKHQPVWEDISNWKETECLNNTREHIISKELNAIHSLILQGVHLKDGILSRRSFMQQIRDLLATPHIKLLPADIVFITQIIKEVVSGQKDVLMSRNVLNICAELMRSDSRILRLTSKLNTTNALLNIFEDYMDGLSSEVVSNSQCDIDFDITLTAVDSSATTQSSRSSSTVQFIDMSHVGVYAELSPNISVFHVNPMCNQISGIAIYDPDAESTTRELHLWQFRESFKFGFINFNDTIESLRMEPKMQLASFVSKSLWDKIKDDLTKTNQKATLVLKLYANDALFVENSSLVTRKPSGKVLSISVPNYHEHLPEKISFMLRKPVVNNKNTGTGCGYWNYNTWVSDGVQTESDNLQSMLLCSTEHLTQFSYLLGGLYRQYDIENEVLITPTIETALDVITLVGCMLSLLGLMGIWLSAAVLSSWRTLASTKILLNMCFALTLQMILVLFVNTNDVTEKLMRNNDTTSCIIIGAALQYATLVLFVWMLIVAFLQFQRYVTVIGIYRPDHYIFKAALLAWLLPLIPTLLLVLIDRSNYLPSEVALQTNTGACYPSELGLILGVLAPVVAVVAANSVIFIYVMYSISHSLSQTLQRVEQQMLVKQLRLSVLLFFLLGISWIFGILSFMHAGIIFSYLFCMTATLQGFVLFIYFIILDEKPRNAWMQLVCPASYKKRLEKRGPELTSMATTSTSMRTSNAVDHHYH